MEIEIESETVTWDSVPGSSWILMEEKGGGGGKENDEDIVIILSEVRGTLESDSEPWSWIDKLSCLSIHMETRNGDQISINTISGSNFSCYPS